jgi:hypothetical protein
LVLLSPLARAADHADAQQIVQLSLAATRADWQRRSNVVDIERDEDLRDSKTTSKTYQVMMIDGTPYNHLIARNGQNLSAEDEEQQTEQLREVCETRANQPADERAKRQAKYRRGQQRMFEMMHEMIKALEFTLTGEATMDGRDVYVLRAQPRPGYQPSSRETKVLAAMQGTLWIDRKTYQWVRAEASVIKPVWFGFFIAKVYPGTKFLLEQTPVEGDLWLPKHFRMQVKSAILFDHRDFTHDETYRDYRIVSTPRTAADGGTADADCEAMKKPSSQVACP